MIRKVYLVIIVLTLFRTSTVAQNAQPYPELSNFYQVDAGLSRGAQPGRGGMYRLSKLGIKTVINLRNNDARARAEEREVHAGWPSLLQRASAAVRNANGRAGEFYS